jgi:hypothetical protein
LGDREHGWIAISRKVYDSDDPFWKEARTFSRHEAREDLIQMAAYSRRRKMVGSTVIELERGELLASHRYLSARWGWSTKKVRAFLLLLLEMGTLRTQRETVEGIIYLLVNYRRYQREGISEESPPAVERAQPGITEESPRNHRGIKGEEGKEGKEGEEPPPTQDAGAREELRGDPAVWMQEAYDRILAIYPPHSVETLEGERASFAAMRRSEMPQAQRFGLPSIRRDGTDDADPKSLTVSEFCSGIVAWSLSGRWQRGVIPNLVNYIEKGKCLDPAPPPEIGSRELQLRREVQAPGARAEAEAFDVDARLAALVELLPPGLPGREAVADRIRSLGGEPQDAEGVEAALADLDSETLTGLLAGLEASERADIDARIERTLSAMNGRLPRAELEASRDRLTRQILRDRLKLPVLSLFTHPEGS